MDSSLPKMLRITFVGTAIVLIALGGGLLFASHWMAAAYGAAESASGTNAGRTAGAAILALGVLAWFGAQSRARVARRVILPVLFIWFVAKSVVAYQALVGGVFNLPVAWTVLGCDSMLAIAYGYFLLALPKQEPERQHDALHGD